MVFQNYALYPHLRRSTTSPSGSSSSTGRRPRSSARVNAVAEALDIAHLMKRKPGQMSGGQQQRVALGRALVKEPLVFLLDEPFSNLDAGLRSRMRTEVKHLHLKLGTTSVFVTHDQEEAMTLSDLIAVMRDGKVVQLGTTREIYRNPRDLYVATFVGKPKMSLVDGALERSDGEVDVRLAGPADRAGLAGRASACTTATGRTSRSASGPRTSGSAPTAARAPGRQLRRLGPAAGADRLGHLRRAGSPATPRSSPGWRRTSASRSARPSRRRWRRAASTCSTANEGSGSSIEPDGRVARPMEPTRTRVGWPRRRGDRRCRRHRSGDRGRAGSRRRDGHRRRSRRGPGRGRAAGLAGADGLRRSTWPIARPAGRWSRTCSRGTGGSTSWSTRPASSTSRRSSTIPMESWDAMLATMLTGAVRAQPGRPAGDVRARLGPDREHRLHPLASWPRRTRSATWPRSTGCWG